MLNFRNIVFYIVSFIIQSAFAQNPHPLYKFDLQSSETIFIGEFKYNKGCDSTWTKKEFNDSSWKTVIPNNMPHPEKGIHFYRAYIKLDNRQKETDLLTLQIHNLPSAYEIYWDGNLIGVNGEIGKSKEEEISGQIVRFFPIKQEYSKSGIHSLAIRFSNFYKSGYKNLLIFLGYSKDTFWGYANFLQFRYFLMGIYLTAVILSMAVAFGRKKNYTYRLFSAYCLMLFLYISFPALVELFNLSMEHMVYIDILGTTISRLSYITIFVFLLLYINHPRKWVHLSLFSIFILIMTILQSPGFYTRDIWILFTVIQFLAVSFKGLSKKLPGGKLLFTGYIIYCLPNLALIFGFPVSEFFGMGTDIVLVFIIIFLVRQQIKKQEKLITEAEIRSQRFEKELLKKYIQPHFLMNTMLSIISWIREDPSKAVKLIQALAEEFQIINKISGEKEILLKQEIELCETHLRLMSYRMDSKYTLNTQNIDTNNEIKIPPLIFHTLIENALTHSFAVGEDGKFELFYESKLKEHKFIMMNGGSMIGKNNVKVEEGMGYRYIKARLEEVYEKGWELTYGIDNGQWKTIIRIYK